MRLLGAFGSVEKSLKWFPIPCLQAIGVAVQVTTKKDPRSRRPRIPVAVLQSEKRAAVRHYPPSVSRKPIVEQGKKVFMHKSRDQDRGKGATEQNPQSEGEGGNTSMQGQLGHRDEDAELKNADSDLAG